MYQVGDVVNVKVAIGEEKADVKGFVYETFNDHKSCKVISENGIDLGSFLPEHAHELEHLYKSGVNYNYVGALHLEDDFHSIIKEAFQ